jgi:hypothetical protein
MSEESKNPLHVAKRVAILKRLAGIDFVDLDTKRNAATLATALELLRNKGFVAKTTDKTRKLASMRKPGTLVKLDPALVVDYAEMYSADELAALEVVRTVGSKVFLKTGAREVGLVDVTKVEVKS